MSFPDDFKQKVDACVKASPLQVKPLIKEAKTLGKDSVAALEYLRDQLEKSSVTEGKTDALNCVKMEINDV